MSVAHVIIEMTHKKIKSANTDMVQNRKKQRTVEVKKQSMIDMLRGTCSKKGKEWRLINS